MLEKTPGLIKSASYFWTVPISELAGTLVPLDLSWSPLSDSQDANKLCEIHTNIFPLIHHFSFKDIYEINLRHTLSSPLCKTALAGLFPASDSLLRCWWDSARHSTSAKRAFRAMAGWVGSWVMLRYAARRNCSSITRACSSNWERDRASQATHWQLDVKQWPKMTMWMCMTIAMVLQKSWIYKCCQ